MNNLLEQYFNVVGYTSTLGVFISAIVSEKIRDSVRRAMFSSADLETTSYDATEAIIDSFVSDKKGGISIANFILLYAIANAAIFALLRALQPNLTFRIDGVIAWDLILLSCIVGFSWYFVSFFSSRLILGYVKHVSDRFQLALAIFDLFITHIIILGIIFIYMFLNIGLDRIFSIGTEALLTQAVDLTVQIFHNTSGLGQIIFSQYLAAYTITFLLWIQLFVAFITRLLTDRNPDSSKNSQTPAASQRMRFSKIINPNADPFMVGTMILIIVETVLFASFAIYRYFLAGIA